MINRKTNRVAMIETLESRRLLSAVTTISADVTKLKTDVSTERVAVKTLKLDLLSSIPAATPGLEGLVADLTAIKTYIPTAKAILSTDITAVVADKGKSSEAAAKVTLNTDAAAIQATLKADFDDVKAVVAKHPTLLTGDVTLGLDEAAVKVDNDQVKADIAALEAAL